MDSNHDLLNQNQTCYRCTIGKYKEVSTRFELVHIPFAEDALTARATDHLVEIKGLEP